MNTKKSKVRLWSVLTALTAILTIAAIVGNMIANQYATTLNVALNASTYKIIKGNTTEDTEYLSGLCFRRRARGLRSRAVRHR